MNRNKLEICLTFSQNTPRHREIETRVSNTLPGADSTRLPKAQAEPCLNTCRVVVLTLPARVSAQAPRCSLSRSDQLRLELSV